MPKSFKPEGYATLTPQLVCANATEVIAFVEKAFGGVTEHVMPGPGGQGVMHAAVRIGDSRIFLSDANDFAKPTSANLFVYFEDVDAAYKRATDNGATAAMPVQDMFWGDRWGMVADPFGNIWQLATHKEVVAPEEMQKRMMAAAPAE